MHEPPKNVIPPDAPRNWTESMAPMSADRPCRESSRTVIEAEIKRLITIAQNLQALLDALPARLPHEADEALWSIVISSRR